MRYGMMGGISKYKCQKSVKMPDFMVSPKMAEFVCQENTHGSMLARLHWVVYPFIVTQHIPGSCDGKNRWLGLFVLLHDKDNGI